MNFFIHGAIMFGFAAVGLFFFRFWRDTNDRLFLLFACAFLLMAVNRVAFLFTGTESELRTYVYCVRLLAFLLIVYAILDKNLAMRRGTGDKEPVHK